MIRKAGAIAVATVGETPMVLTMAGLDVEAAVEAAGVDANDLAFKVFLLLDEFRINRYYYYVLNTSRDSKCKMLRVYSY